MKQQAHWITHSLLNRASVKLSRASLACLLLTAADQLISGSIMQLEFQQLVHS